MLWEQIEQSGFLQQLPLALGLQAKRLAAAQVDDGSPQDIVNAVALVHALEKLQPSFLTAHAAGQQYLVPTMQLGLSAFQYTSMALAQGGRQDWVDNCLGNCWETANAAAYAAAKLLASVEAQQATGRQLVTSSNAAANSSSDSSRGSDSGTSQRDAAYAVLQAESTTQWLCMSSVMTMLAHWQSLQGPTATSTGTCRSSSRSTASSTMNAALSSSSSSSGVASASRQHSHQPVAGSGLSEQRLSAAVPPSMPAA